MKMEEKRDACRVIGRDIGTGTGWDDLDQEVIIIYDFIPAKNVDLPSGTLCGLYKWHFKC